MKGRGIMPGRGRKVAQEQRSLARRRFGSLTLAAGVMLSAGPTLRPEAVAHRPADAVLPIAQASNRASIELPQGQYPITPAQAIAVNSIFPPGTTPGPAAPSFILMLGGSHDYERALNCLTMAIYYEAGAEPHDGQRAVAQVVLNRVRHPAFPNSVCGVVFQGSQRSTGCQFSFTCDGSRARVPSLRGWARSRAVAAAALAGEVYPGVGFATHYHANYVLPYWASSLSKSAQVGNHIFYRWPGVQGTRPAFRQGWAGGEPGIPTFRPAAPPAFAPTAAAGTVTEQTGPEAAGSAEPPVLPRPRLLADEGVGDVVADERSGELLLGR